VVTERPLQNGQVPRIVLPTPSSLDPTTRVVLGAVVVLLGLLQWLPAARFTVDGWTAWINVLAAWLGFDIQLPSLLGPELILTMVIVGLIYSWIETKCIPVQRIGGKLKFLGAMALVGWLFLTATDIGSTYTGLIVPPPNAFQAWQDIAHQPELAAGISFYLTFAPDWFILGGLHVMGINEWLRRIKKR